MKCLSWGTEWFAVGKDAKSVISFLACLKWALTQLSQTGYQWVEQCSNMTWCWTDGGYFQALVQMWKACRGWVRQMLGNGRNSAVVSPILAAVSWSMQSQIQTLAKNAAQLLTVAESECCFKCHKSCTASHCLQHLCRGKWPWLFCHEDLTKLANPLPWPVYSGRKCWREEFLFFSKTGSVSTYWSKKARLGHRSGYCSWQTEGTNLTISNIPLGSAQKIHFWITSVVQ